MTLFIRLLYIALGLFLSINQGITLIVGNLRNGQIIGSDVFMPVDFPLYLLLFLTPNKSKGTKYWFLGFFVKLLIFLFYLLSFTGESIAYDNGEFRFQMVHLTRAMLIFFVIASRLHDRAMLKSFVVGLLLGLGFQSAVGFWQWQVGPVSLPFFNIDSSYRVSGLIGVPNAFGAYLITLIPLAIRVIFFTNIKPKWLWVIITIFSLGSLYATYTRGAWLAFVGAMFLFTLKDLNSTKIKTQQKLTFVAIAIIFMAFMGAKYGGNISARMQGSTESLAGDASQSRLSLAKDALRIINDNKVFGVGLNNYRNHADQATLGLRIVHNAYLLIGAEQGLFALFLFVLAHLIVLIGGLKLLSAKDRLIYNVGSATLTGYLAILVYHLIAPDYRMVGVLMNHWRLPAMILALLVMSDITDKQILRKRLVYNKKRMNGSRKIQNSIGNGNGNGNHQTNINTDSSIIYKSNIENNEQGV